MLAKSHLTGKMVNRFTHVHQSCEDLLSKVKMQRLVGRMTGSCFQRCVGMDAINAVYSTTFEMDQKHGTNYHENFKPTLRNARKKTGPSMAPWTDPKGNRAAAPSAQVDPDMFVRVVERRDDGIVVSGAKMHQTGALNSHEILVMPTLTMREADADFAVAFPFRPTTPAYCTSTDARQRHAQDGKNQSGCGQFELRRSGSHRNFRKYLHPLEKRVHVRRSGLLRDARRTFCRVPSAVLRAAANPATAMCLSAQPRPIAEYNGVAKASHVKDKIIEMVHLNETIYCGGIACSAEGRPTTSGGYLIDMLLANICKQNVTRLPYEIARLAQDIAGGLMVTMPSNEDFESEEVGEWCKKLMVGDPAYTVQERQRMLRLIESMTVGSIAVGYLTESLHGAGSPQAQRIMIGRQANMDFKKGLARRLCGIDEDVLLPEG